MPADAERSLRQRFRFSPLVFTDYADMKAWLQRQARKYDREVFGFVTKSGDKFLLRATLGFGAIAPALDRKRVFHTHPSGTADLSDSDITSFLLLPRQEEMITASGGEVRILRRTAGIPDRLTAFVRAATNLYVQNQMAAGQEGEPVVMEARFSDIPDDWDPVQVTLSGRAAEFIVSVLSKELTGFRHEPETLLSRLGVQVIVSDGTGEEIVTEAAARPDEINAMIDRFNADPDAWLQEKLTDYIPPYSAEFELVTGPAGAGDMTGGGIERYGKAEEMPRHMKESIFERAGIIPNQEDVRAKALGEIEARLARIRANLSGDESRLIDGAIDFIRSAVMRQFSDEGYVMAVQGPEEYILGYGERAEAGGSGYFSEDTIALIDEFFRPGAELNRPEFLAETILHEALEAVTPRGEHEKLYKGIQRKMFGDNVLKIKLRDYIDVTADNVRSFERVVLTQYAEDKGMSVADLKRDTEEVVDREYQRLRYAGIVDEASGVSRLMHRIHAKLRDAVRGMSPSLAGFESDLLFIDDNNINACVYRGRTDVFFFRGLYQTLVRTALVLQEKGVDFRLTEDVLAFIIAHELAHAVQQTQGMGLGMEEFYEQNRMEMPGYIYQMKKNAEFDADMVALDIMDKAGYSVYGAIDAMQFLERINTSYQIETILESHPHVTLRKHKLMQIAYDQETSVFLNADKRKTPVDMGMEVPSRYLDFAAEMERWKTADTSGDSDIRKMARSMKQTGDFDRVKGLMGMCAMRKGMSIVMAIKDDPQVRLAFARSLFLDAAFTALNNITRLKNFPRPIYSHIKADGAGTYNDLTEAAAINDYISEGSAPILSPVGAVSGLAAVFQVKGDDFFEEIRQKITEYEKLPTMPSIERAVTDEEKAELTAYVDLIQRLYENIDEGFMDAVAGMDPASGEIPGAYNPTKVSMP
ncbi:MAG: M48 family metalloprotease, partial [Candidatus Omnitrophota bacterium]